MDGSSGSELSQSHPTHVDLVCAAILPIEEERAEKTCARMGMMTKILLVEDSKFLRMATERALTRAGYSVVSADQGGKAVDLAAQQRPDVILLDMLLPGIAGPDVLKALKSDASTASIPVIAFTGLSPKNETRLRQDGASAFLEKATLELDKGSGKLLEALADILHQLDLKVPAPAGVRSQGNGNW
jgi:two-component system, cell cycle response regulator DivK